MEFSVLVARGKPLTSIENKPVNEKDISARSKEMEGLLGSINICCLVPLSLYMHVHQTSSLISVPSSNYFESQMNHVPAQLFSSIDQS
ncbi:hypothetical protein MANES_03G020950v8 [Manihot esculenta]|uniref:Uncharacterized protein n=1 Tax=Manihot esculenta TaxID=3983 RepID=A0ACB7HWK5_MANES|nr:hypothetical protein MANES_03G020950v8 [Manihot esculenta]